MTITRSDELPSRIGAEFSSLDELRDPGIQRWPIERQRIGPVIRNLLRTTDPLFRRAGIDLDEGA